MKKLLLIPLLALLAFAPIPTKSIKQLIGPDGIGRCSAWSYGKGRWITANHCLTHGKLPGLKAIKQDAVLDLAVIEGEKAPAIPLAAKEPYYGDTVMVAGFPGGQRNFYAMVGPVVAVTKEKVDDLVLELVWTTDTGLSGLSGAPVLNTEGQVIGTFHAGGIVEGINFGGHTRLQDLKNFLRGLK